MERRKVLQYSADRNVSILSMDSTGKEYTVNLDDYCRMCLRQYGSSRMRPLKSRSTNFGRENVSIPDMLVFVCGLPANLSNRYPQNVCNRCVKQLEKTYRVCRQFKEKESILESFYSSGSVLESLIQYESFRCKANSNEFSHADQNNDSNSEASSNEYQTEKAEDQPMTVNDNSKQSEPEDVKAFDNLTLEFEDINIPMQPDDSHPARRPKYIVRPDGMFECMVCSQTYDNRQSCKEHCNGHEAIHAELYKCRFCSKCFGKQRHVQTHERSVHSDEIIEQDNAQTADSAMMMTEFHLIENDTSITLEEFQKNCAKEEAAETVDTDTALEREDQDSDNFSTPEDCTPMSKKKKSKLKRTFHYPDADGLYHCEFCSKEYSDKRKYLHHLYVHRALLAGRYKCQYCSKCFGKKYNVEKHEELVHRDEIAKNDPSPKIYKQKSWTLTHQRVFYTPEADGLFHCQHCSMKIDNRRRFVQHQAYHRALLLGRYRCRYCKKCFGKKWTVQQHEKEVHRKKHIASSNVVDDSEQQDPNGDTFDDETNNTFEEYHDTNFQENFTKEEVLISDHSDAEFEFEQLYSEESVIPAPKKKRTWFLTQERVLYKPEADGFFHCQHCTQRFEDRRKFAQHQSIHRAFMESRYKCGFCEKLFSKKCHLDRHVNNIHLGLPKSR